MGRAFVFSGIVLFTSLAFLSSARADPLQDIAQKLKVVTPPVGRTRLANGTARPYVEAKRALARGQPGKALKALKAPHGRLFADREALVRGDALLALGEMKAARAAFERALDRAVVPSVARSAVRGLAEVYAHLGQLDLAESHLDALLKHTSASVPPLLLAKARLYARSKDLQRAMLAAEDLVLEHPESREARAARSLQASLVQKGAKPRPRTEALALAQAKGLIAHRQYADAQALLAKLDGTQPEVVLLRASVLERRGKVEAADALLHKLTRTQVPAEVAVTALKKLARRALRADDNDTAQRLYDRLVARAPGTPEALRAEYMAGWIPYDAGRYPESTRRMLKYAEGHPRANDRDEALWFAGWSSYLAKKYRKAQDIYERIIEEHPRSALVPHVHYWLGRIAQQQKRRDVAKAAFQEVLARAPLGYYALWATRRLKELGEQLVLPVPPTELKGPASVEAALASLGPNRPLTVDRAILLHRADRPGEAIEELQSSARVLRKAGDAAARIRVADLLHQLGAHHLAFRAALGLTQSGTELQTGEAEAWKAWRHAYPKAYKAEVDRAEAAHEVPTEMVWAIMRTESHYRPWARSRVGARGLMQLMPATARHIGRVADGGRRHAARLRDPESNIWLGTWYLGALIDRYGGQLIPAVGAYNGGPTAMDRWLKAYDGIPLDEFVERIPYRQTRRYVRRVVETWAIYQKLYDGRSPTLPSTIRRIVDANSEATF